MEEMVEQIELLLEENDEKQIREYLNNLNISDVDSGYWISLHRSASLKNFQENGLPGSLTNYHRMTVLHFSARCMAIPCKS
jgi:hypothetical protein